MNQKKHIIILFLFVSTYAFAQNTKRHPFGFHPIYLEGSNASTIDESGTLEAVFPADRVGPNRSGFNFEADLVPMKQRILTYDVKFPSGFEFVKGGKLPGLCGGDSASGGERANGKNGFSVRVMWKEDGRMIDYVYHMDQESNYGDVYPWTDRFSAPTQIKVDGWNTIKLVVRMNDIDKANGLVETYLNGERVFQKNNFRFRTKEIISIDKLCFNTFFGGNDKSWAPSKQQKLWIKNLKIE